MSGKITDYSWATVDAWKYAYYGPSGIHDNTVIQLWKDLPVAVQTEGLFYRPLPPSTEDAACVYPPEFEKEFGFRPFPGELISLDRLYGRTGRGDGYSKFYK